MHPHLGDPDKENACSKEIAALEECHRSGMMARYFGGCNDAKAALVQCLRAERLERTARNREEAKQRTEKKKKVWEELEKDK